MFKNSADAGETTLYNPENERPDELVIARIEIVNPYNTYFDIPDRFLCIFNSKKLAPGSNIVRYPVINITYQRLLNEFIQTFPNFKMKTKTPIFEEDF